MYLGWFKFQQVLKGTNKENSLEKVFVFQLQSSVSSPWPSLSILTMTQMPSSTGETLLETYSAVKKAIQSIIFNFFSSYHKQRELLMVCYFYTACVLCNQWLNFSIYAEFGIVVIYVFFCVNCLTSKHWQRKSVDKYNYQYRRYQPQYHQSS